jgi:hypothetical protein
MRRMVLAGSILVLSSLTVGGAASNGAHMSTRQWAIVNFTDPVTVRGHLLMGQYLIVHDDDRMAKGEPCTSIYRFDRERGPQNVEVEFACKPDQRAICDKTTFSVRRDPVYGLNQLTEYQFAGDPEVHGVPAK